MGRAISLREDFDSRHLRRLARQSSNSNQTRRLLALAVIYDGGSRSEAAVVGGVGLQIIRDWGLRFNQEGPAGLLDRKSTGVRPKLNTDQRQALAALVERGPYPSIDGVVRWRLADLAQWVWEEYRISVSSVTIGRVLRDLGYRKLTARPRHHGQNDHEIDAFKKTFPSK